MNESCLLVWKYDTSAEIEENVLKSFSHFCLYSWTCISSLHSLFWKQGKQKKKSITLSQDNLTPTFIKSDMVFLINLCKKSIFMLLCSWARWKQDKKVIGYSEEGEVTLWDTKCEVWEDSITKHASDQTYVLKRLLWKGRGRNCNLISLSCIIVFVTEELGLK